jgi:hypothetical protein
MRSSRSALRSISSTGCACASRLPSIFAALGFEGEEAWRVAARIKVLLLLDPDVRWLCGVHEAEGHFYLIRERYEELLWWLLMPSLLRLAGESAPSRSAVEELSKIVAAALASAEAAGYRIDVLLGPKGAEVISESQQPAQKMKPQPAQEEKRQPAQEMKPQPAQRKKPRKKRARKPGK